jgi:general secretion pathway protein D
MKTRNSISWFALSALAFSTMPASAQPTPAAPRKPAAPAVKAAPEKEPPGAQGSLPTTMDAIAKAVDVPYHPKPAGHLVKFNLQDADLAELVNHISGLTGKRFIYGAKVRQIKATVVSPEPVTLAEAYEAFLSILESNGMTVVPHGRFLKIVDSGGVVNQVTPVFSRGEPVPASDRYVTRLYRMQNIGAEEAANLLNKFKSKEGDVSIYAPGQLLIITDTGSNVERLIRILEEIDIGGSSQSMWVEHVNFSSANELAQRMTDLFGLNQPGGAQAAGLSKVLADQQSNSLIVVGREDAYMRLLELLKRLDGQPDDLGRIRVLPLQHAKAEDLANVMNQMLQGAKTAQQNPGGPGAAATQLFEGELKVVADKATNSLVITSSGRDYATLRLVVTELDMPRRQVFIEAVIMDLDASDSTNVGAAWHAGYMADLGGSQQSMLGTGFMGSKSVGFPNNQDLLQGFAVGARGPGLNGTQNLLLPGVTIPAFGVVMNALTTSGASNVLATPHIIATDNAVAEINIGKNVALQQNAGGGLGNLAGLAGAAGQTGAAGALGGLGGLGMLGGFGFAAPRQDVGIKIKMTPHINDSNQVRLDLDEESSDTGAAEGALGAIPVIKRTAHTTITVEDQQTVVIGGLMRETLAKSEQKIPLLGDIPVLGFLFRQQKDEKKKSNLLLILTPYIVREQADLRKIFERKMQERQEFLDRYFVFGNETWTPPRDYSRANGLVEDIRQQYFRVEEQIRLLHESAPTARLHRNTQPIDLPRTPTNITRQGQPGVAQPVAPGAPGVPAAPAPPGAPPATIAPGQPVAPPPAAAPPVAPPPAAPVAPPPTTAPPTQGRAPGLRPPVFPRQQPRTELDSPVVLHPMARSVNVERME